ncbi:MAG: hypothetical protein WD688_18845 [Candidatus Binatia bacterium]
MAAESVLLDEQGMIDLARKTIEELRNDGISPNELRRLENVLKEGGVGEALILSSLLKTITRELSPDASQRKLLQIHQGLADICHSLVELSRNLFEVEVWQHFRSSGHESFDAYCTVVLGIPESKIEALKMIKHQRLPRPKKAGSAELFAWLLEVIQLLTDGQKRKAP